MAELDGRRAKLRTFLDVLSTSALVLASAVVVWAVMRPREAGSAAAPGGRARAALALPAEPVSLDGAILKGDPAAPVALLEFSEFQCPFCAKFATDGLQSIVGKYVDAGRLLLAFRHLPLEAIHPFAFGAAEVATCADRQGRFWGVHDAFFQAPRVGSATEFRERAITAGVRKAELEACLGAGAAATQVRNDLALARSLKLESTPVFLFGPIVDGRVKVTNIILGAKPVADFESVIDLGLKAAVATRGSQ